MYGRWLQKTVCRNCSNKERSDVDALGRKTEKQTTKKCGELDGGEMADKARVFGGNKKTDEEDQKWREEGSPSKERGGRRTRLRLN